MRGLMSWIGTLLLTATLMAQPPQTALMLRDAFPVSKLKPGMKGYGLSVFKGTQIERFEVEVVGVLENANFGRPLVLIKMKGGPITGRQANIIAGMSGSPIFINGKILGAVAYGFSFPREPHGLVTPLEDMLTTFDPRLNTHQRADLTTPRVVRRPIRLAGRLYAGVHIGLKPPSAPNLAWAQPLMTPLMVSGLSPRGLERLRKKLEPYGLMPVMAPGGVGKPIKVRFEPGAAFGAALATGDLDLTAIGTLTYRKGNYVLAFGHPFFGMGEVEMPITAAEIVDVFPSYLASFKLGNRAQTLGTVYHDGAFAVAGQLGRNARMMPIRMRVTNAQTGVTRTYRCEVFRSALFTPILVEIATFEFIGRVHFALGDATATVRWTLKTQPYGEIRYENRLFSETSVENVVLQDLNYVLGLLQGAPDRKAELEGLEMEVIIQPGRHTAFIERLTTDKGAYRPGETVRATAWVRPTHAPSALTSHTFTFRIPYDAMPGRYTLQVASGGGGASVPAGLPTGLVRVLFGGGGGASTPSTEQLLREFQRRERNYQLVATLTMQAMGATVQGEPLRQMPPLLREILTSPRASGIQPEPDQVKVVQPTEWVLQGSQMLFLTVLPPEEGEGVPFGIPTLSTGTIVSPPPPAGVSSVAEEFSTTVVYESDTAFSSDAVEISERFAAESPITPGQPPAEAPRKRETPVSRAPKRWELTDFRTLSRGKMEGVAVRVDGALQPAPRPQPFARLEMDYVWSLARDAQGNLYAGGGIPARLAVVNPDGSTQRTLNLPGLMVTALTTAPDGTLYVGVSPKGTLHRLKNGNLELLTRTGTRYINALLATEKALYIATGVPARLLVWDGSTLRELLRSDEAHFTALARDSEGNLYIGTSERGLVYRLLPMGFATVVADLREPTVSALACDGHGNLYIGTMPAGNLYRLSPDGALKSLHPQGRLNIRAMLVQGDTLYALTPNNLYSLHCGGKDESLMMLLRQPLELVCMASGAPLTLASAYDAQLWSLQDGAPASSPATSEGGIYLSPVLDAGQQARWGTIRWDALVPDGAQVEIQTRSGNTREPDASWSEWSVPYTNPEGSPILSPSARFLQVRVRLSGNPAPQVRSLALTYIPANRPPEAQLTAPKPYTVWSDKQTVRWTARDPDGDTLRFEVQISRDGGKSWQKLKDAARVPAAPSDKPDKIDMPNLSDPEKMMQELRQALESSPDIPPEVRAQIEQQAPELIQQMQAVMKQLPTATMSTPPPAPSAPPEPTPSVAPRQMEWDTTKTPDGIYLLRLMVSDQPASPTDYAEIYTPPVPVIICNTPPVLSARQDRLKVNEDRTVELTGYALQVFSAAANPPVMSDKSNQPEKSDSKPKRVPRNSVPIVGVQYRLNKGEWLSAEPLNGLFDSAFEMFRIKTEPLEPGEHTLTIKAFNAAGKSVEQELKVHIPAKP
ncbi:MAG: SpoIVB peptidase S55 domain-containing protein, partial [Armatimonadota bacterium]